MIPEIFFQKETQLHNNILEDPVNSHSTIHHNTDSKYSVTLLNTYNHIHTVQYNFLICYSLQSLQWFVQNNVILDHIIMTLYCICAHTHQVRSANGLYFLRKRLVSCTHDRVGDASVYRKCIRGSGIGHEYQNTQMFPKICGNNL